MFKESKWENDQKNKSRHEILWTSRIFGYESFWGLRRSMNLCHFIRKHPYFTFQSDPFACFLKWWVYPTTMGFPTKNDHFGVFWGYPYFWKHPFVPSVSLPHRKTNTCRGRVVWTPTRILCKYKELSTGQLNINSMYDSKYKYENQHDIRRSPPFNRKYIFIHGGFFDCHVSFRGFCMLTMMGWMVQTPMTCRSFTAHTALARFSSERRSHARRSFGVF